MDVLTPQQAEFLKNYLDPKSETFSNSYQSAKKAGYEDSYATNILSLMPKWLSSFIERKQRMILKAEKRLETSIESEDERVGLDATKFTLSRLDKANYSERQEHTGKDGKDLIPQPIMDVSKDPSDNKDIETDEEN